MMSNCFPGSFSQSHMTLQQSWYVPGTASIRCQVPVHVGATGLVHCLPHVYTKHSPFLRLAGPSVSTSRHTFPTGMMGITLHPRDFLAVAPHPQTLHGAQDLAQQSKSSDRSSKPPYSPEVKQQGESISHYSPFTTQQRLEQRETPATFEAFVSPIKFTLGSQAQHQARSF